MISHEESRTKGLTTLLFVMGSTTSCIFLIRENCITGLCGWPKLQITHCGIKNSFKVLVVDENYKLLPEVVFRLQT